MASTSSKSIFWCGARDCAPFLLVICPFGMLFGVVATEAGLSVFETLTFSIMVIAGAAQFTAIQLIEENAPTAVIIVSALAVNLRMAMYSASLTPHIGKARLWQRALIAYLTMDQSYAMSIVDYEKHPTRPLAHKIAYFFGCVLPLAPMWYLFTLIGALVGKSIPPAFALDFAMPITFLAMIAPMLRTPPHVVAAGVAVITALLLVPVPYNLGLLISGLVGMIAGAQTELWLEKRTAP